MAMDLVQRLQRENAGLRELMKVYNGYFGYLLRDVREIKKADIADWMEKTKGFQLRVCAGEDTYFLEMVEEGADGGREASTEDE